MTKSLRVIILLISLFLVAENISAQEYYFISEITVKGNKQTKLNTILRELPFKRGDIVKASAIDKLMEQGRENITNLSLFNSVSISKTIYDLDVNSKYHDTQISIVLYERWYYWPRVNFKLEERNFSSWIKNPDWHNITLETGVAIKNVAGKNQSFKTLLTSGFNKGFKFDYSNLSLDKQGKHFFGISFSRLYSRVQNVSIVNNAPFYIKSSSSFLNSNYSASISYTFRQKLRMLHNLKLQFAYTELDSAVLLHNPNYWGTPDLYRRSYSIEYDLIIDERDNIQYPLKGYYIYNSLSGYASNKMEVKYMQLKGDYHYYTSLFNHFYISTRVQYGLSKSNLQGYIFNKAIGYNNINLRGYEFYIADGQHYFLFSPTAKYNFLPKTYYNLKFLSSLPRFSNIHLALYGKVFSDLGYAWHKHATIENGLSNKVLHSWGLGVDVVSYYDITLSLDYSFNNLGKHGFFISLMTPLR